MKVVRRKFAAMIAQFFRPGLPWRFAKRHANLTQAFRALFQIAFSTSGHDVFPAGDPTSRAWHHMIKGQISTRTAVLTAEFVPEK